MIKPNIPCLVPVRWLTDIIVQEYGRYFGMPTVYLRKGCLTGPNYSGVELHGFLSYLIRCNLNGKKYLVYGYKDKQVPDNFHSLDVTRLINAFIVNLRIAEFYNIGGGKQNCCSIFEAFKTIRSIFGKVMRFECVDENRIGDHMCCYCNLSKMKDYYPGWDITISLQQIMKKYIGCG